MAVLVAGTGLYGTLSLSVSARSRELGIRAALGARGSDAITLVMSETARILIVGCLGGALATLVLINVLRSVVFGLDSVRALPVLGAVTALAVVSLLAAYRPAARAANVDPIVALKEE